MKTPNVRKLPSILPDDTDEAILLKKDAIAKSEEAHQAKLAKDFFKGKPEGPEKAKAHRRAQRRAREALIKAEALDNAELAAKLEAKRLAKNQAKKNRIETLKTQAQTDPEAFLKLKKQQEQKKTSKQKSTKKKTKQRKETRRLRKKRLEERKESKKNTSEEPVDFDSLIDSLNEESKKLAWRNERNWYNLALAEKAEEGDEKAKEKIENSKDLRKEQQREWDRKKRTTKNPTPSYEKLRPIHIK
jgi:hypothetical protein